MKGRKVCFRLAENQWRYDGPLPDEIADRSNYHKIIYAMSGQVEYGEAFNDGSLTGQQFIRRFNHSSGEGSARSL